MDVNFTPIQTVEEKLSKIPIVNGQIIICVDSGFMYRDTDSARIRIGTELEIVDSLPENPIDGHFYYSKADCDLFFYDGKYVNVSENELQVNTDDSAVGVTLSILENGEKKSEVPIKGKGVTRVFKDTDGSISIKTKEPDAISNLEIDKLLAM